MTLMDMVHAREWGCLICAGIKRTGAPKLVAFRVIGAEYHPKTGALSHLHTLRKAMEHRPLPARYAAARGKCKVACSKDDADCSGKDRLRDAAGAAERASHDEPD